MSWILWSFFLMTYAGAASIPVLSLNEAGQFIQGEISDKDYTETLKAMKQAIDEKVVQKIVVDDSRRTWQLSKISIGLGVTGEIGVGPYKYSSALRQRFFYSRVK